MPAKKHVLAVCVYVDGKPYGPGEVPASIAKKIDNDKVWKQADDEQDQDAGDSGDQSDNDA